MIVINSYCEEYTVVSIVKILTYKKMLLNVCISYLIFYTAYLPCQTNNLPSGMLTFSFNDGYGLNGTMALPVGGDLVNPRETPLIALG